MGAVPIRRDGRDPLTIREARADLAKLEAIRAEFAADQAAAIRKAGAALDALGLLDRDLTTHLARKREKISAAAALDAYVERLPIDLGDMIDGGALQDTKDRAL